ncbi:flippase activity-associated protein Agl23 [Salarchaeum japonicum]|uniref:flippase activity-associated protein Agl23 n=1 Tax=Salarchaeum japonicum TaxID=555573 RepID=UPI003C72691D
MLPSRLGRRRVVAGLLALTAAALLVRFWALGLRAFHWDEGRVGYWILRYVETGHYDYEPIIHGPFLYHVNKYVFGLFGATDATARAVVALVGGLLPLAAWLFRDHLTDVEILGFAGFLAINPVLVYYSRFMRNDVLVAGFSLLALGLVVRALATGRRWYWPAAVVSLALAFTTKANAVLYLACWAGALLLVADHRVLGGDEGWVADLRAWMWNATDATVAWVDGLRDPDQREGDIPSHLVAGFDALADGALGKYLPRLVGLGVLFSVVIAFFFAPRPGLLHAFTSLDGFEAATLGAFDEMFSVWGGGHEHSYVEYLELAVRAHAAVALPLSAFAVAGFVYDRYWLGRRDFVEFCAYWGLLSVVGYPIVTDIPAHWSLVHAMVPLAVPAAVGVGWIAERGVTFWRRGDRVGATVAAVVLVCVAGYAGATAYQTSYANAADADNPLVQYGQPGLDDALLADLDAATDGTENTVLFYGEHFHTTTDPSPYLVDGTREPQHWSWRLPLPWYLERFGADSESTLSTEEVTAEQPPVVVALAEHYDDLNPALENYTAYTYRLTSTDTPTVFWIRNDTHDPA